MFTEPRQRISDKALTIWRIYGGIQVGLTAIIGAGLYVSVYFWNCPIWLVWIAITAVLLELITLVWLGPSLKWRRWRYEVTDQDIELQYGIIIVKRTIVPMVRVQHVDTEQGPLLRKCGLSTISISTAATVHKIPALDQHEAENLRQSISALAKVAADDV